MNVEDILRSAIESPDLACEAYGDESIGDDVLIYAIAITLENHHEAAEEFLSKIKRDRGVAETERLHCRVLFAGNARAKSAWAHLSLTDVFDMYLEVVDGLRAIGVCFAIVVAVRSAFPKSFSMHPPFSDIALGPKQLALFCQNASVMPLVSWFGHERFKFWPDPDETPIDWLGERRKVSSARGMFTDFGGVSDQIIHGTVGGSKPTLLEAADMAAYVSQRALSKKSSFLRKSFRKIYRSLEAARVECALGPDGGFGMRFPESYRPRS